MASATEFNIHCEINDDPYEFHLTAKEFDADHIVVINNIPYFISVDSPSKDMEKVTSLFVKKLSQKKELSVEAITECIESIGK